MNDETKCLHAGYTPGNAEPRVVPIVQSTTYVYDSTTGRTLSYIQLQNIWMVMLCRLAGPS